MIREEGRALVVEPTRSGRWTVNEEDAGLVSEHGTAGEALAAARSRARSGASAPTVLLRDLYGRTHTVGGRASKARRRPAN